MGAPQERKVKHSLVWLSVLLFAAAVLPAGFAAERIRIEAPLVDPQTPEAKKAVEELLEKTAAVSGRLNGASIELAVGAAQSRAAYSLGVVAALGKDSPAIVLTLKRLADGAQSAPYSWLGAITPELPTLLARAVFLQLTVFTGFSSPAATEPPVLVGELPAALIQQYAYPWTLAVRGNGNLLAALGTSCVELDRSFRIVGEPGKSLGEAGPNSYAIGLSLTPGDTVVLKPAQGRDLWRVPPGSPSPQKLPTGLEVVTLPFAALPDGSVILADSTARKAYRVAPGRKRQEVPLFASAYEYIAWFGVGPDGTIWIYDYVLKAFRIVTPEGAIADYMLPLVDPARPLTPLAISIGPDGSSVVLASGQLAKFLRDGTLVWRLDSIPGAEMENLPASGSVAVDWARGLVYVADTMGRRIVKLLDRAYCRQKGIKNDLEEKLVSVRSKRSVDEAGSLAEEAALYEQAGSPLMAKAAWQKVEEVDPGNETAAARLSAIEITELAGAAAELDGKAREIFRTIGIETARLTYMQAIQKYELLLSKAAGNAQARRAMESLKTLFSEKGGGGERPAPLLITEATLPSLFPSLMLHYAATPVGAVTVKNPLAQAAQMVRASVSIPRFMDYPAEAPAVASLAPGASESFALTLPLNRSVLELQEDMAVQAKIDVAWGQGGAEQTLSRIVITTIHRNTALTWDDTSKIASFVTPNEEVVNGFARRALAPAGEEKRFLLSSKLFQAMRICDALGAHGITYVEDPSSPISKSLGKTEVVDTVQLPRTTLFNRAGDCDDTTALLCSALEAIGVRTAILTTPGHIFLAFDSGEPAESGQLLADETHEIIARGGAAWIPIETTTPLQKGFLAAWAAGSELVRKYRTNGPFEFIPLEEARKTYPALPLPQSTITVAEPAKSVVDGRFAASIAGFTSVMYTGRLASLEAELKPLAGRQAARLRARQGILHALFGRLTEAGRAFEAAMKDDPTLVSPYVNLANVRLIEKGADAALAVVASGLARSPDSMLLNLAAARCWAQKGDRSRAAEYLAKVKKAAPDVAERYALILGIGPAAGGAQRAADESGRPAALLWGGGE
jgi:tetratricopeptide (TPR) repeat protein